MQGIAGNAPNGTPRPSGGVVHEIDSSARLVRTRAFGHVTLGDVLEGQRRLRASSLFHPNLAQVFDCTEVTKVDMTPDEVFSAVANSPFGAGAYRVMIIPESARAIFLGIAESIVRDFGTTHRVVHTAGEAYEWLASERALRSRPRILDGRGGGALMATSY